MAKIKRLAIVFAEGSEDSRVSTGVSQREQVGDAGD
jgi:hypothetical protein